MIMAVQKSADCPCCGGEITVESLLMEMADHLAGTVLPQIRSEIEDPATCEEDRERDRIELVGIEARLAFIKSVVPAWEGN